METMGTAPAASTRSSVTRDGGSQLEVHLDGDYNVVGQEADEDGPNDNDGPNDD